MMQMSVISAKKKCSLTQRHHPVNFVLLAVSGVLLQNAMNVNLAISSKMANVKLSLMDLMEFISMMTMKKLLFNVKANVLSVMLILVMLVHLHSILLDCPANHV